MSGSSSESSSGSPGRVRLSLRVAPEVKEALDRIQELGGMNSIADAIRRAIGDELFLQEQMAERWKVLLERDNVIREVVWPKF
jgi:monoamine oxidase